MKPQKQLLIVSNERCEKRKGHRGLTISYLATFPFFFARAIHFLRALELLALSVLSFENMLRLKLNPPTAIKVDTIAKPKIATMQTTMKSTKSACSSGDSMAGRSLETVNLKDRECGAY